MGGAWPIPASRRQGWRQAWFANKLAPTKSSAEPQSFLPFFALPYAASSASLMVLSTFTRA